jgi:hypothetical protein
MPATVYAGKGSFDCFAQDDSAAGVLLLPLLFVVDAMVAELWHHTQTAASSRAFGAFGMTNFYDDGL